MGQFNREEIPFPLKRDTFKKELSEKIKSTERQLEKIAEKDEKERMFVLTSNLEAYRNIQSLSLKTPKDLANAEWLFNDGNLRTDEEINDVNEQQRISDIVRGRYYRTLHHPALWGILAIISLLIFPEFYIWALQTGLNILSSFSHTGTPDWRIPYISDGMFMGFDTLNYFGSLRPFLMKIQRFRIPTILLWRIPVGYISQFVIPLALAFAHKKIIDMVFGVKKNPEIKNWKPYKKFSNPVRLVIKWLFLSAFYSALLHSLLEFGFKSIFEGFMFGYATLIIGAAIAYLHEIRCAKWFDVPASTAISTACLTGMVVGAVGLGMSERQSKKVRQKLDTNGD